MFKSIGIPHGFCYLWDPGLLALQVSSDLLIALAYFLIPVALLRIVRKRRDIPYNWMLLCFGAFIIACGSTHLMEVVTLWYPLYWISGTLKAFTAVVSLGTFILLLRLTPDILAIPSHEALAAAHHKLESVLESTTMGMYAIDNDWKISYINQRARNLLTSGRDVAGSSLAETLPMQSAETRERMKQVMASREPIEFESYYAPIDLWSRVKVHPWENGGITVFFTDISKEKRLQRELDHEKAMREQRIEALAQMAGGLAHEISNPLGIIHARATNLLEMIEEGEELTTGLVTSSCQSIVKTSDRAIRILRGLRMFAREGAQDPMLLADVPPLLEQTVALVQQRFTGHSILLRVNIQQDMAKIRCREVQIGQIVLNLLNNAFDAVSGYGMEGETPESGRWVCLEAKSMEGLAVIEVIDGGPGVSEKNKPNLMKPFFTTKPVGAGMGVGLSLSRAIAHDHGGDLILTDYEGHTCFRLTIPAAA